MRDVVKTFRLTATYERVVQLETVWLQSVDFICHMSLFHCASRAAHKGKSNSPIWASPRFYVDGLFLPPYLLLRLADGTFLQQP